jgi:hypothetical protein
VCRSVKRHVSTGSQMWLAWRRRIAAAPISQVSFSNPLATDAETSC